MLKLFGYITIRLVGTPFVEGRNIFEIVNIPILRSEYIRYPNPPLAAREAARATPQLAAAPVPPVAGEQRPQAATCKAALSPK